MKPASYQIGSIQTLHNGLNGSRQNYIFPRLTRIFSPQWAPHADTVLDQASGLFQDIPSGLDIVHLPGELDNFLVIPSEEISLHMAVIGQEFSSTFFNQLLEAKMNWGLSGRGSAARTLGVCLFFYRKLRDFRKLKPSIKQRVKQRWTQDFLALTNGKAPYCGHIFCHPDTPLCDTPVHIRVPVVDTCLIEHTIDGQVMTCSWRNVKEYQRIQARCSHYRCQGERLKLDHLSHVFGKMRILKKILPQTRLTPTTVLMMTVCQTQTPRTQTQTQTSWRCPSNLREAVTRFTTNISFLTKSQPTPLILTLNNLTSVLLHSKPSWKLICHLWSYCHGTVWWLHCLSKLWSIC